MISLATGYFRCCRPAERPPKKVAWARKVERVKWRSQPGMAGQGDTGAAEQSSRPPPVGGLLYLGGGGGLRGRHPLDLGAYTRVGGGVRPVVPAPAAAVSSDAVADADPAVGATTAARRTYTHVGSRHMRKVDIDKEMAAAPNALSAPHDAHARSISQVPCRFWGSFLSVRS